VPLHFSARHVSCLMSAFVIHHQLRLDCHVIGRLPLCHLLLHRNACVPWFILVPETGVTDLLELADDMQAQALQESRTIAKFIKAELGFPKINFAAIGNVVPQLHLHVVGRKSDDPCWPAPVWGRLAEGRAYDQERIAEITQMLRQTCGLEPV